MKVSMSEKNYMEQIEITGGESVYCLNETQLRRAYDLVMHNPQSSGRLLPLLDMLESEFSRNEQAALAFVLIDRLLKSDPK